MPGGVELATAYVTLKADGRRLPGEAAALGTQSGKAFGKGFERSSITTERAVERIGRTSKRVFLAGALGIGFAEKKAADYNAQMATVFTLAHANTKQQAQLAKAAKTVGVNIGYSATKTGQAEEELVKAGVSVRDMLSGGLKGALDLAAAGQTDVATATEVAASAMTQFSLKGKDVPHIADLLAAGADKALGSVSDLGYGLSQAGTTAHQMNLSIEDTVGTLAEFAQNGLIGERAGTTLKMMLLRLANPTQKSSDLMDKYNLSIYKANGQLKTMPEIADQLQKSFKDLAPAQRNAALGTIFGSRAIQAANILIKDGEAGNRKWIKSVNDQGFAAHQAAGKMDSLKGDAAKLNAELENAFINASGKQSFLRMLAQDATGLLKSYNKLSDAQRELINKTAVKVVAGAGIVWAATKVYKLAKSTSEIYGALFKTRSATTAIDALGGGLGKRAGVTPVYVTNWGGAAGAASGIPGGVAGGGKGAPLVPLYGSGNKLSAAQKELFGLKAGSGLGSLTKLGLGGLLGVGGMVAFGGGSKTVGVGQQRGKDGPTNLGGALDLKPADIARLSDAQKKMLGLSKATKEQADSQKFASAMWQTGYDLMGKINPSLGKYSKTLDTIPKEIRSYISTPGAPMSMDIMKRIAKQYNLTPKQIRTVMSIQGFSQTQGRIVAAGKAFRTLPKQVKTALRADTVKSESDVKKLQRRYNLTPKQVQTVMHVSGVDAAIAKAHALAVAIAAVRSKSVTLELVTRRRNLGGGQFAATAQAAGGTVGGRRTPYGDKVLTLLAPGEEVISNQYGQADRHRAMLKAINANRMASGGSVGGRSGRASAGDGGDVHVHVYDTDGVLLGTITGVADSRYYANSDLHG